MRSQRHSILNLHPSLPNSHTPTASVCIGQNRNRLPTHALPSQACTSGRRPGRADQQILSRSQSGHNSTALTGRPTSISRYACGGKCVGTSRLWFTNTDIKKLCWWHLLRIPLPLYALIARSPCMLAGDGCNATVSQNI